MSNWPDIISAIGTIVSAVAAIFSLAAFMVAMKMQSEDSINDVRPELLLSDWTMKERSNQNVGCSTSIYPGRIRSVGRGAAFNISIYTRDPKEKMPEIHGATMICPYLPPNESGYI